MTAYAPTQSQHLAVTNVSAAFTNPVLGSALYAYVCTVDSWVTQAASAAVATAGDGSMFVPAKTIVQLDGALGASVAAIRDGGSSGTASLTPVLTGKLGWKQAS